jgi:hypothetical protein
VCFELLMNKIMWLIGLLKEGGSIKS